MSEERRTVRVDSYYTPTEFEMLQEKMKGAGITNMSAYLRKMALDGLMIRLNMKEIREMIRLLRIYGNNLNQITRRVNETNRFYDTDLAEIQKGQDKLWGAAERILHALAKLE